LSTNFKIFFDIFYKDVFSSQVQHLKHIKKT